MLCTKKLSNRLQFKLRRWDTTHSNPRQALSGSSKFLITCLVGGTLAGIYLWNKKIFEPGGKAGNTPLELTSVHYPHPPHPEDPHDTHGPDFPHVAHESNIPVEDPYAAHNPNAPHYPHAPYDPHAPRFRDPEDSNNDQHPHGNNSVPVFDRTIKSFSKT
eukprot:TRINITY_DN10490_c0_g1_i4.p1 TRINITY_DN10490_c0_g1~~TRINITY_DN10490_c0_g1_i4.p1  ORF type:complete len:160 (-),score=14.00 TRINITY_DN10490_c0_g1_i4:47-526(-)